MTAAGHDRTPAPRVLVADNDEHVAAILREFLRRRGLDVTIADDGRNALARLRTGAFAAFVCDLDMPVMSGHAVLAELADAGDAATCPPIVVISGYVDDATAARLKRHPAVREVIRKPFDLRIFAERVAALADAGAAGDAARGAGGDAAGEGAGEPGCGGLFGAPAGADQKSPRRP